MPDVVQRVSGVQTQEQRTDTIAGLRQPIPPDDAVERGAMLDLHPPTLTGQVGLVVHLGQDTVLPETISIIEPRAGCRHLAGPRSDQHDRRGRHRAQVARRERPPQSSGRRGEPIAPIGQRKRRQLLAAFPEQIEEHQRRGELGGELADPGLGRMQTQLELVELHRPGVDTQDLAIRDVRDLRPTTRAFPSSSGKYRPSGRPSRLTTCTAPSASTETMVRNPSHFGS